MSRARSLPSDTSTSSAQSASTRSSAAAAPVAAIAPPPPPRRTERGSVSDGLHLVADLDLGAALEAAVLDLEAHRAVEDQRGAVGAIGRTLDGVEALLAKILEHALDQTIRDALAVHLRPPELRVDAEGE